MSFKKFKKNWIEGRKSDIIKYLDFNVKVEFWAMVICFGCSCITWAFDLYEWLKKRKEAKKEKEEA